MLQMETDRLIANRKKNQERLAPGSSAGPREVRTGEGVEVQDAEAKHKIKQEISFEKKTPVS